LLGGLFVVRQSVYKNKVSSWVDSS
jgi:hypothetical protein